MCANGHDYTRTNTRYDRHGRIYCNTCVRDRVRAFRARAAENPVPCRIDDCPKPSKCKGLCSAHYERLRRHGTTDLRTP